MAVTVDDVKRELNITWDDKGTNEKLEKILIRAENTLTRAAGREIDFDKDLFAQQILFDCCRYIFSDAFKQFKIDYEQELLELRLDGTDDENGE